MPCDRVWSELLKSRHADEQDRKIHTHMFGPLATPLLSARHAKTRWPQFSLTWAQHLPLCSPVTRLSSAPWYRQVMSRLQLTSSELTPHVTKVSCYQQTEQIPAEPRTTFKAVFSDWSRKKKDRREQETSEERRGRRHVGSTVVVPSLRKSVQQNSDYTSRWLECEVNHGQGLCMQGL